MTGALMAMMGGAVVFVSCSPTTISHSSTASSWTFSSVSVSVTNGTASSYTWSFSSQTNGTFSVISGAGTSAATAQVTSVGPGPAATANFNCAVVVNGVTYNVTCTLSHLNTS